MCLKFETPKSKWMTFWEPPSYMYYTSRDSFMTKHSEWYLIQLNSLYIGISSNFISSNFISSNFISSNFICCVVQEEEFQDKRSELERKKLQIEKEFKNLDTQVKHVSVQHLKCWKSKTTQTETCYDVTKYFKPICSLNQKFVCCRKESWKRREKHSEKTRPALTVSKM